jgi:serine/threonine protein kinase
VLRTLEYWSSNLGFEALYKKLPFGSRIVFANMEKDIRQIQVQVVPTHDLERQYLSLDSLLWKWGDVQPLILPPTLDLSQLKFIRQMHDSTSLVEIQTGAKSGEQVVFKTISDSPRYLYHELKLLLTMESHQSICSHPLQLVTKRCRFGGKTGLVGFTMKYELQGTLRDILPERRISGTLLLKDQLKWSRQITKALLHITTQAPGFYCDLRLDNILLSETDNALLIDFEQRGVLPSFAPPEVNHIQSIESFARDSSIPPNLKDKYLGIYNKYIEPHVPLDTKDFNGCVTWLCLSRSERDAAMVYMLGRVFWCIFEGVSAPEVATWMAYLHDPDLVFPNFCRTPLELRGMILECTKGRNVVQRKVRRCGKSLFVESGNESVSSEEDVLDELRREAQQQLKKSEQFLEEREGMQRDDPGGYYARPLLKDVLMSLENFGNEV